MSEGARCRPARSRRRFRPRRNSDRAGSVLDRGETAGTARGRKVREPKGAIGEPPAVLQFDQGHDGLGDLGRHGVVGVSELPRREPWNRGEEALVRRQSNKELLVVQMPTAPSFKRTSWKADLHRGSLQSLFETYYVAPYLLQRGCGWAARSWPRRW
jgi:hypothetical protein